MKKTNINAVCITGLERSYLEISRNVKQTISILHSPVVFGVRPRDSWNNVDIRFGAIANQTTCAMPRIPQQFFPPGARLGLKLQLCDLSACEQLMTDYEILHNVTFALVMRLRLDLFWEIIPVLPSKILLDDVFVPKMSHCGGICDKFAIGGRNGMRSYFVRKRWVGALSFSRAFNSEMFLRAIGKQTQIRFHENRDWVFCKFGSKSRKYHSWPECTTRIRARVRCEKLFCDWCGRGCRCVTAFCTAARQQQRTCFLPNASTGKSTYEHRRGFVSPGLAQVFLQ